MLDKIARLEEHGVKMGVLDWYASEVEKKRKTVDYSMDIANDIAPEVVELMRSTFTALPNYKEICAKMEEDKKAGGKVAALPNGHLLVGKRIMRVAKYAARYLDSAQTEKFNKDYSVIVNKSKVVGRAHVTNNLLDCLCSSEPNLSSCQNMGGDRWFGTLIYYLCNNVYLGFIEDAQNNKLFRQWIYLPDKPEDMNCAITGRAYPEDKRYGFFIRQMIAEKILGIEGKYNYMKMDSGKKSIEFHNYNLQGLVSIPYHDVRRNDISSWIIYPEGLSDKMKHGELQFNIPLTPVINKFRCLFCGKEHGAITDFYGSAKCITCQPEKRRAVAVGEGQFRCDGCGDIFDEREACSVEGGTVCSVCFDDNYFHCPQCDEHVHNDSEILIEDEQESVCESCYENGDYFCCDICGCHYTTEKLAEDSDPQICKKCDGVLRKEEEEKEKKGRAVVAKPSDDDIVF